MIAASIMSKHLHVVTPDETVAHAAELMRRESIGIIPVVDSPLTPRLVGILTDRDIAVRHVARCDRTDCTVAEHMTHDGLITAREEDHVHDVMGRMRHYQLRRLPVLDAQHRVVGIVAQADIARVIGPEEPRAFEKMVEAISTPSAVVL